MAIDYDKGMRPNLYELMQGGGGGGGDSYTKAETDALIGAERDARENADRTLNNTISTP